MPTARSASKNGQTAKYVSEYLNELIQGNSQIVYCSVSDKSIAVEQRCRVTQSLLSNKYKDRKQIFKQSFFPSTQTFSSVSDTFNNDLCRAFINADIPLAKLQDTSLSSFLENYTNQTIPNENALRENCIQPIYKETLMCIRNLIDDGPTWVSIDETADANSRFTANIIIGK